jgi:D-beta-D-heptose 7-phosphate kinase/D-beta-D-heptose 1-phosphate adenosyltransferase
MGIDGQPLAPGRVLSVLRRVEDVCVWIVGDVMLDEYVEGSVSRVSPEAPVPVVHVTRRSYRLGGAANVAHQAVSLGARVQLCGAVGTEQAGDDLIAACREAQIGVEGVVRVAGRPTTRKVRVIAQHQQMLRLDLEDASPAPEADLLSALDRLQRIARPEVIVLSDYAKGVLSTPVIRRAIGMGRELGVPVIVDPKARDLSRYEGASLVTPNLRELEMAVGASLQGATDDAIAAAARSVLERVSLGALLVTLGERGMMLIAPDGKVDAVPTLAREVYDVTGAGDTVVAAIAVAGAAGMRLPEAARFANAAAGVVVGKVGTATASASEIARVLGARAVDGILDRDQLREQVAWWRLQGKRVVFTNGCYDLLHAGHIALLRQAALEGDVLVVALNSDASVARLKGPGRPVIGERDRAELIRALSCVGAVTLFDEDTPLELIRLIEPDVLVKGGDYTPDQVVGREVVEGRGGVVRIIPLVPGRSTTELVRRIRHSDG